MSESQKLAAEAVEVITRDILELPAGRESGTAKRLVDLLVGAAVARISEANPVPAQRPVLSVPKGVKR